MPMADTDPPAGTAKNLAAGDDTVVGWTGNLTLGSDTDHAQCVVVELVTNNTADSTTKCPPAPTDAKCCQFLMDGANHYFSMPVGACNFMGGKVIGSNDRCTTAPDDGGGSGCVIS